MKVNITIEQFEEGITIRWNNPENGEYFKELASNDNADNAIGRCISSDISNILDKASKDKILMTVEYRVID